MGPPGAELKGQMAGERFCGRGGAGGRQLHYDGMAGEVEVCGKASRRGSCPVSCPGCMLQAAPS